MRLNKDVKEALARRIVGVKFNPIQEALKDRMRKLADHVYNAVYSIKLQDDMEKLPTGTVPSRGYLQVATLTGVRRVYFRGHLATWGHEWDDARLIMDKHKQEPVQVSELLMRAVERLWDDIKDYEKERSNAQEKLEKTLASFTTKKSLIEVWPEAAALLPEDVAEKVRLPAIQRDTLNTEFGLTVKP